MKSFTSPTQIGTLQLTEKGLGMYNPDAAERLFEPEALQTTPVMDVAIRTSRFVHKFLGTSSCELDHALGTVTMHVRECLHLMRTSDTAHQSYDNDVGQSARQQSHADHTGRDPRTAHDGHGQSMAATNVRNGCKRGTGCHCEDSCKLSTCSKFEAYLAWNLLTGVDAPYNQMRTSALVTSRDTGETQACLQTGCLIETHRFDIMPPKLALNSDVYHVCKIACLECLIFHSVFVKDSKKMPDDDGAQWIWELRFL
ncbi:hypothetical protein AK812_SmicGene35689 [Symbiodinium microadriaticum]|uniref:Uncharacterized protein n=1 Tax=Symbiodinium microadriaticum TaxID=2951 RepID=A0A1Q9CKS9_SYMMI|nr:hypothetical protein AK812_SmicGene35689 [Symbiodinium microadriaticum]